VVLGDEECLAGAPNCQLCQIADLHAVGQSPVERLHSQIRPA